MRCPRPSGLETTQEVRPLLLNKYEVAEKNQLQIFVEKSAGILILILIYSNMSLNARPGGSEKFRLNRIEKTVVKA